MNVIALFKTTRNVVRGEELGSGAGIPLTVIPTPKQFTKNCGMSLRFDEQYVELLIELLEKENIYVTIFRG